MTLAPLADLSVADWFVHDTEPAVLRANVGPPGFESYARVLHGDFGDGTREEGHLSEALLRALCGVLARHTSTPDDCVFGLWDGYGDIHGGEAAAFLTAFAGPAVWPGRIFRPAKPRPPVPPAFTPDVLDGPRLGFLGLQYLLFEGPLASAGQWGAAGWGNGAPRGINSPNLMWPVDRTWFVTTSIEGTWTGVGGTAGLIDDLLRDDRLEVVRQRYDEGALR